MADERGIEARANDCADQAIAQMSADMREGAGPYARIWAKRGALIALAAPSSKATCSCMEVAGEDPNCIKHGNGTLWAKEHPDICELASRLTAARAPEGVAGLEDAVRQYRNDLLYPPAPDSVERHLQMIARVLGETS